ncbi:hypothetical protein A3Q56_00105 [Intoshia linei]|uniref:Uncharacterized protein n=1 Tax=Intoshia linei TaxID=1819745 RepID=A0A177BD30_9BILA|nr:hypothetical protein A3Q56_00105 [Intoshia linei]
MAGYNSVTINGLEAKIIGNFMKKMISICAIYLVKTPSDNVLTMHNDIYSNINTKYCITFNTLYLVGPSLYELISFIYAKYFNLVLVVLSILNDLPKFGIFDIVNYRLIFIFIQSAYSIFLNIFFAVTKVSIIPFVVYMASLFYVPIVMIYDIAGSIINTEYTNGRSLNNCFGSNQDIFLCVFKIPDVSDLKEIIKLEIVKFLKTLDIYIIYGVIVENKTFFKI